jgi:hypothetical protein
MKTVIVGGVAAGASTGARLGRLDESAEIVVLERDRYVSFANCACHPDLNGDALAWFALADLTGHSRMCRVRAVHQGQSLP